MKSRRAELELILYTQLCEDLENLEHLNWDFMGHLVTLCARVLFIAFIPV